MGKFFLKQKAIWFKHLMERAHEKKLAEKNLFSGAPVKLCEEVSFTCEVPGITPTSVCLMDLGDTLVAVENGNGVIGHLDEAGSKAVRDFFKQCPWLHNEVPAFVCEHTEWNDSYSLRIGLKQ